MPYVFYFQCSMILGGVVGVAGTQRCSWANEKPQQAAYSSNKILFTDQTSMNTMDTHSRPNIHSKHGPQRRQANGTIESSF